jgi:protein disulfide-isomerase
MTTQHWDQALAESRASGKPLMLFFTGSDWCKWCIRLEQEVLDTPEFAAWSRDHVVVVEVDFPREAPLAGDQRVLNETLRRQYEGSMRGFPSVLFTDSDGNLIGKLGYEPGGATPWIAKAEAIIGTPVTPAAP